MSLSRLQSLLVERPLWRTSELAAKGINSRSIKEALDRGIAIRPEMLSSEGAIPGILANADADLDPDFDDALAMMMLPQGVIARHTAALRHGMGDGMPRAIEVIVPHEVAHLPRQANVKLLRTRRAEALTEGVATRATALGVDIRMTTPARTVVDLFRSGHKVPGDVAAANAALAAYIAKGGAGGEVKRIARHFEDVVLATVEAAVDAATESLTKGYAA